MKFCLDPGHGGFDPGAVGVNGCHEKNINLTVCLNLAAKLKKAGIKAVLTREVDSTVSLAERVHIANEAGCDFFLSLHCNSALNREAHGTETCCYKLGHKGEQLAKAIQGALVDSLQSKDRGAKQANFYVLRNTKMPAALVELGFLSNHDEADLLITGDYQAKCVQGIQKGIRQFLKAISEAH